MDISLNGYSYTYDPGGNLTVENFMQPNGLDSSL